MIMNNSAIELLIDKSGSMNATDGNHLAKSAVCQFVDHIVAQLSRQKSKIFIMN